ncbi:hypothetical protein [Hymenobacter sp.]|uniref:hypothetical protein n=1 Tax=Hymenobacter sp. TaxID=1898978 RepID=UPI00286A7A15|nr:hypothetical protein [Hymenobacter sp.]
MTPSPPAALPGGDPAADALRTRNWVLAGALAGLMLFVQALMTFVMTSAAAKMDVTSTGLARVLTAVEVMNARNEALSQRVVLLEEAVKESAARGRDTEVRVGSLEARVAIHDNYLDHKK